MMRVPAERIEEYEAALKEWVGWARAHITAYELLSCVACEANEPDEMDEVGEDTMFFVHSRLPKSLLTTFPLELVQEYSTCDVTAAKAIASQFPMLFPEGLQLLADVRGAALSCLANMLPIADASKFRASEMWSVLCAECTKEIEAGDAAVLSEIFLALRFLSCRFGSDLSASASDMQHILEISCKPVANEDIQCHCMKIVASIAPYCNCDTQLVKRVGVVLLLKLATGSLSVRLEAMDAVFDLFAEPDHNEIVRQLKMMEKLRQAGAALEGIMEELQGEDREVVGESILNNIHNLQRFIEYKNAQ